MTHTNCNKNYTNRLYNIIKASKGLFGQFGFWFKFIATKTNRDEIVLLPVHNLGLGLSGNTKTTACSMVQHVL